MGLVARANPDGVELRPAGGDRGGIGLSLVRQGCAEGPRDVAPVKPTARDNRVEYARDGVTEWYVNGPLGLEQGFTVARDLGCRRELVFEMALAAPVVAELQDAGTVVAMSSGGRRYRYGELYAYDADGRELASSMELVGRQLRLIVGTEGARYPVVVDPRMYIEQAQIAASDGAINDTFGSALAFSGETAVVGAPNRNTARGQAYVYQRTGSRWSEQAKLNSSDGTSLDNFGAAVAIDGNTVVIGAPQKNAQLGQAYVFVRAGTKWSQQAVLTDESLVSGDYFGSAVAVSGDTAVVGLSSTKHNVAYVFARSGTAWSGEAKLVPGDSAAGDRFGLTLAADGDTILVGAPDKAVAGRAAQGAAFAFVRTGTAWSEQAMITSADGAAGDRFGDGLALRGDTAVIGADRKKIGDNDAQGAAYVVVRSGATWSEQARLLATDGAAQDRFGGSVAVGGDVVLVGASQARIGDSLVQGAAYLFTRTDTTWGAHAKLTASNGFRQDSFGNAVALSPSGNTALVAANQRTIGQNLAQGGVYVYGLEPQPEGSACITGSDCLSGSCVNSLCAVGSLSVDMGSAAADAGSQLALIGSGYKSLGCSVAAGRPASPGLLGSGMLFGLLALGLLALGLLRRKREPG